MKTVLAMIVLGLILVGCGKKSDANSSAPEGGDSFRRHAAKRFAEAVAEAEAGNRLEQFYLGRMYDESADYLIANEIFGHSDLVRKDDKEAVKWYRKAAEQGDDAASYYLGAMYAIGRGVPEDDKEAVKWYRKAAEQGNADAQAELGLMYRNGEGVPMDSVTAYAWCNIAAANGNANAKKNKLIIGNKMPPDQIAAGQELTREMIQKNPKLLAD